MSASRPTARLDNLNCLFTVLFTFLVQNWRWRCAVGKISISRNRFRAIKENNRDVSDNKNDRFAKLRLLFDRLHTNFAKFGVFSARLSIYNELIPFFGRHTAKMFMRNKTVRFSFKTWCMYTDYGYLFQFIPYAQSGFTSDLGREGSVVLGLMTRYTIQNQRCWLSNVMITRT